MSGKDEQDRYASMLRHEQQAWQDGYVLLAGVDEAGRGPLAGPVAAAACILDPKRPVYGVNDSKKLSAAKRAKLYDQIIRQALSWHVVLIDEMEIDRRNILGATRLAMLQAVSGLDLRPDLLLVDAVNLDDAALPVWPIVRGDAQSVSIAAASILAKVTRDRKMEEYDRLYPGYGFARHKGYGTREHYEALLRLGPCPIHRRTFLRTLDQHAAARCLEEGSETVVPAGEKPVEP